MLCTLVPISNHSLSHVLPSMDIGTVRTDFTDLWTVHCLRIILTSGFFVSAFLLQFCYFLIFSSLISGCYLSHNMSVS